MNGVVSVHDFSLVGLGGLITAVIGAWGVSVWQPLVKQKYRAALAEAHGRIAVLEARVQTLSARVDVLIEDLTRALRTNPCEVCGKRTVHPDATGSDPLTRVAVAAAAVAAS